MFFHSKVTARTGQQKMRESNLLKVIESLKHYNLQRLPDNKTEHYTNIQGFLRSILRLKNYQGIAV